MSRRRPIPPAPAAAFVAAAALGLLLSSCMEDPPPAAILSDIGVVEGRILEAGQPVSAELRLYRYEDFSPVVEVTVRADSTGWYHAELPLGLYQYRLWPRDGNAPQSARTDTINVGRCVRRLDLARGRARVTAYLPPVYAGLRLRLAARSSLHETDMTALVSGDSAVFTLPALPPETYGLRLSVPYASGDMIVYLDDEGASLDSLRVTATALTTRTVDCRDNHAVISGRVTGGPDLAPIEVQIDALTAAGRQRTHTGCDDDGRFRLDLLAPEPVRLRARYRDSVRWFGGASQIQATLFDLHPGDALTDVDLTGCGLRILFDGPGDLVTNGATVLLRDENGAEQLLSNYWGTRNPVEIDLLPPGRLRIMALGVCVGQAWQPQWYDGAATADEATFVTLEIGRRAEVSMNLEAGGVILGRFQYHNDMGRWYDPAVTLHDLEGHRLCPTVATMDGAALALRGVPDGTFLLGMYLSSVPWWYPGTYDRAEAVPVTIAGRDTVSGLVWEMPFPYKEATP